MFTFNDQTFSEMTRKPFTVGEARTCYLHGVEPASVELVTLEHVTIPLLEGLITQRCSQACHHQFAVHDLSNDDVFAVSTEGADYPRYLGRFSTRDALALVKADRSKPTPPKPAQFTGFVEMSESTRRGYEGCEGYTSIGYLANSEEDGVWQFDLVVDEVCFQLHYNGMNGEAVSWGIDMADREIALRIARRVAKDLCDAQLDVTEALNLDGINGVVVPFGMERL